MNKELKDRLIFLAATYETETFLNADPSQFLRRYSLRKDIELAAFVAANLAFGRRDQIIKHMNMIIDDCDRLGKTICQWTSDGDYMDYFTGGESSFYRMFTHNSMTLFFKTCAMILQKSQSLGDFFKEEWEKGNDEHLFQTICRQFPRECNLIPHGKNSSCKRINMFLRWMVRDNSPVDTGFWNWYDKSNLLMPMDTHVLNQACQLGLLQYTASGKVPAATLKNCIELTEKLKEVFEGDPVKGDFALFGLGVNS